MSKKILKVKEESDSGFNTSYINEVTGRTIGVDQAIEQIKKGNQSYDDYHVVNGRTGEYVRSNPDRSKENNIE